MAQSDFYGTWNVFNTAGTSFGIDSTVTIAAASEGGDQVDVTITFPSALQPSSSPPTFLGTYDPATDAVVIEVGDQTMFISRYVDVAGGFYALYGLTVIDQVGTVPARRLGVWVAHPESVPSVTSGTLTEPSFDGTYIVRSTVNAQFGLGSPVVVSSDGTGVTDVTITNLLLNEAVGGTMACQFDPSTCSLRGSTTTPTGIPIVVQISLASRDNDTWLYGLAIAGDPEQAGVWGAEDDPSPEPM